MQKRVQLLYVALMILSLLAFDGLSRVLTETGAITITGAAVTDQDAAAPASQKCEKASPCAAPAGWKCTSSSSCYEGYNNCLRECKAPATAAQQQRRDTPERSTGQCSCGNWETTRGCGQQGCKASETPQFRTCTGGPSCKTENRCAESDTCKAAGTTGTQPTTTSPSQATLSTATALMPQCTVAFNCDESRQNKGCGYICSIDKVLYNKAECESKCLYDGVNLVPELEVTAPADLKAGGIIKVSLYARNIGAKSTHDPTILGKCAGISDSNCHMSFYSVIYYTTDAGTELYRTDAVDFTMIEASHEIKAKGENRVLIFERPNIQIPRDMAGGKIVVTARINSQASYGEAQGGLADNTATKTLPVKTVVSAPPNLVPLEPSLYPKVERLPATITSAILKVKNTGGADAVADFIYERLTIMKDNTAICKTDDTAISFEDRILGPGKEGSVQTAGIKSTTGDECKLTDKEASYRIVVEADINGFVKEASEDDNKQTFAIIELPTCTPVGKREAGKYCEISSSRWQNQKAAGQPCENNFECLTEMCISGKCMSDSQKTDILKIAVRTS